MKITMRIVLATALGMQLGAVCNAQEVDKARILEAENKMLRASIKSMRKEVSALKSEVQRLKVRNVRLMAALKASGAKPPKPPGTKEGVYMYRGRRVSKEWFDRQYGRFADKIVLHRDTFYDAGEAIAKGLGVWTEPPPVGSVRRAVAGSYFRTAKVVQVLAGGAAIVELRLGGIGVPVQSVLLHVKGLGQGKVDGVKYVDIPLVYLGPFTYTAVSGARATIQGYRPHRALTRKEFADALAQGFELVEYRKVKKRVRVGGGRGEFRGSPRRKPRIEERVEIVPVPVR